MRVRRLLASVVTVGLVAPAAAIVATSGTTASAATATRIVSGSTDRGWLSVSKYSSQPGPAVYGTDRISLSINVQDANGAQVYDGGLTVQRLDKGSSSWKTVASSSSAYLYDTITSYKTATYRVLYAGTAEYSASSAAAGVKAQRKLDINTLSGRKAGFKGKLSPKAKTKIVVQKKVGKKYKKFKTLKSNKKGRFTVVLPAPRKGKFFWKITFKGSKGFASSTLKGNTYKY